jgi:hypothetical protein
VAKLGTAFIQVIERKIDISTREVPYFVLERRIVWSETDVSEQAQLAASFSWLLGLLLDHEGVNMPHSPF